MNCLPHRVSSTQQEKKVLIAVHLNLSNLA
ncbi:hypothetical protein GMOD_00002662 [Pyrenophora seminiperda CCB06]|uniref:Uncharacterized protein n=1 Tax=Pyrenophora seminiperda CCB06 TaxID=1302712 RepID=A0A3M7M336_9PLEO|nr:hypothetical protein GMOD_00002662 [Pyrenophora seminiperda CCB06]